MKKADGGRTSAASEFSPYLYSSTATTPEHAHDLGISNYGNVEMMSIYRMSTKQVYSTCSARKKFLPLPVFIVCNRVLKIHSILFKASTHTAFCTHVSTRTCVSVCVCVHIHVYSSNRAKRQMGLLLLVSNGGISLHIHVCLLAKYVHAVVCSTAGWSLSMSMAQTLQPTQLCTALPDRSPFIVRVEEAFLMRPFLPSI